MHILEHNLPERNVFNFVLGVVVVFVVAYAGYLNYAQYRLITDLKAGICDEKCVREIVESRAAQNIFRIDQLERPIAAVDSVDTQVSVPVVTPTSLIRPKTTSSQPFESSKSISGGGVASTQWQAVSTETFGFDTGLYPVDSTVTFEGWVTLSSGAGRGFVRLYDLTNNRMVDGSEVVVEARDRASFYSPNLSIWRGFNQYRLEARSDTGYPIEIDGVRLVIKKM